MGTESDTNDLVGTIESDDDNKGTRVFAYTDDEDMYCAECAAERFGCTSVEAETLADDGPRLRAVFDNEDHPEGIDCADCNAELLPPVWADRQLYTVKLWNTEDDPSQIAANVTGEYADRWANHHGSLDGGTWERADGPTFIYGILY